MSGASESTASSAPQGSLRQRMLRAGAWQMSQYLLTQVVRVGATVILAYLLAPEHFGLVQICTVVIIGLRMFSEIGVGPAIVQGRREDALFLDTAWCIQILRGVFLFIGALALAWPTSLLYESPALTALLVVVGGGALIDGFNSTRLFTLNRQLAEGRRATLDFCSRVLLARAVMIVWAWIDPSAWALVAGNLVGGVAYTLGSHFLLPGIPNRLRWESAAFREIFRFGRWIFIGTVIAFFGQQLDKLMLGKLSDVGALGVYGVALSLAVLPAEFLQGLAGIVLFPALAEINRTNPQRFAAQVVRIREALLPAGAWVTLSVILASPLFFEFLYRPEYGDAGWIAPWAALASWVMMLNQTGSMALLARGRTQALAWSGLARGVMVVVGCLTGFWLLGTWGFVLGTVAAALAGHLIVQFSLARDGVWIVRQDLAHTLRLMILAGAAAWVSTALRAEWGLWAQVAWIIVVLGATGYRAARRTLPAVMNR